MKKPLNNVSAIQKATLKSERYGTKFRSVDVRTPEYLEDYIATVK